MKYIHIDHHQVHWLQCGNKEDNMVAAEDTTIMEGVRVQQFYTWEDNVL